jgi:hypothetical protein
MGLDSDSSHVTHFHIQWSQDEQLDWASFPTRELAEVRARELVQPNETYTIVGRGELCERCGTKSGTLVR